MKRLRKCIAAALAYCFYKCKWEDNPIQFYKTQGKRTYRFKFVPRPFVFILAYIILTVPLFVIGGFVFIWKIIASGEFKKVRNYSSYQFNIPIEKDTHPTNWEAYKKF